MHEYTYDVTMFRDTFETRFTYLNGFLRNVSRFGDRPALFDPRTGRRWNYRQLNAEANRLAHALRADGVGKNDVVMFALLNSPEFVFCYLAAHKVGAIACPVNYRQGAGEIALVIDDSRPKAFFYDAEFADLSGQALRMCGSKPRVAVVVNGKVTIPTPEGQHSYEEYVAGRPDSDPPIDFDPHIYDETTRLYTSGTTGCPKGGAGEQHQRGALRPRRDDALPPGTHRPHHEHDPLVPPGRHPCGRTLPHAVRRRRGGDPAGLCPPLLPGIRREIQDFLPDRRAHHHRHAGPDAGAHPCRPVRPEGHRDHGRAL